MRVCFVSTSLSPAGAETALAALVVGIEGSGIQPSVIALRGALRLVE
jgi:hypothetical protein